MFRLLSHTLVVARKVSRTRGLGQNLLRLARYDEATDVWYIESARVFAFTVGFISPKVCISTKADEVLDGDQRQVVLDHEHQHARSRDALRLLLVELLGAFHLPRTHRHLVSEFELAREQICDDAAAGVEDRLLVAETILVVSRLQRHEPQPPFALAFGQREVEQRVRVLLEHPARRGGRRAFASVLLVSSVLFLGLHAHIHHALEALLATLH